LASRLPSKNVKIKIYKTIILPVVLYWCEKQRQRVLVNRWLRRLFSPKKDDVTRGWRKLHYEKLHNLYFSPNVIRIIKSWRMRWAWHVARMGEK
jgi:hypothetical protein